MKEMVVGTRPQTGEQPRPLQDQFSVPGLTEPLEASLGTEFLHWAAMTGVVERTERAGVFRVAVLDDEADAAASICACLCQHKIDAQPFAAPSEVVAALAHVDFDAFVLDWCLANKTSADLIEALRHRLKADAPIFILSGGMPRSGLAVDDQLTSAIERHRLLFRAKPISCAVLAVDLKSAIASARCSPAQLSLP